MKCCSHPAILTWLLVGCSEAAKQAEPDFWGICQRTSIILTMWGKPWENHGKTMGKPWENDILTILTYKYQQKWRLYGISNSFMIAKLVHITPTTMVYDRQITL